MVLGEGVPEGLVARLTARLTAEHVEVETIDGGQPHYPLLFGAE